jgi:methanethiol S-methyltransferase
VPELCQRFLIFALVHSLLATETAKNIFCRNKNIAATKTVNRYYRLTYNLLAGASFIWVLAAPSGSRLLYALSGYPQSMCRALQACAGILFCWCTVQTDFLEFAGIRQLWEKKEQAPSLIRHGCYRRVRHPQYSLAIIILFASPTMNVNYLLFSLMALIYFIVGGLLEESRLCRVFGEEYRRYQQEVPMFVPHLISVSDVRQ